MFGVLLCLSSWVPLFCYSHDANKISSSCECFSLPSSASVHFLEFYIMLPLCWSNLPSRKSPWGKIPSKRVCDNILRILHVVPSSQVPFTYRQRREQLLPNMVATPFPSALPPTVEILHISQVRINHQSVMPTSSSKGHISACEVVF